MRPWDEELSDPFDDVKPTRRVYYSSYISRAEWRWRRIARFYHRYRPEPFLLEIFLLAIVLGASILTTRWVKLVLLPILLAGCAGLASYQPKNADEGIRIVKEAGGSGCMYQRISGSARPYADVETRSIGVFVVGNGPSFLDCLGALPEAQKSLAPIPP